MGTPHKHADVLRAIADGKEVQWQSLADGTWYVPSPHMNPIAGDHLNWRIKPEPEPDVERYGVACLAGAGVATVNFLGNINGRIDNNLKLTFDGETGKLKAAEVLK